jgi:hypothetical protein
MSLKEDLIYKRAVWESLVNCDLVLEQIYHLKLHKKRKIGEDFTTLRDSIFIYILLDYILYQTEYNFRKVLWLNLQIMILKNGFN